MKITTESYLIKLKNLGLEDSVIAGKMGISVGEVRQRWAELLTAAQSIQHSGYTDLVRQFTALAKQYELLGQHLKILAFALDDHMPVNEIGSMISEAAKSMDPVAYIMSRCIILKPFTPKSAEESLQEDIVKS